MTPVPTFKIRRATPGDSAALVGLMREFYAESDYPLDDEQAGSAFLTLLANPDLGLIWVATQEGTAAGYVVLTFRYTMEHGSGRQWFLACKGVVVMDKLPMISLGEPPAAELSR